MRITVEVSDSELRRLEEMARRFDVSPDILVAAAVHDLVNHDDSEFARVADRVLRRNSELYRRLA